MNRADLHKLANARVREAWVLFEAHEHSGAYYLAGYAVECGWKACFAKSVKRYDFPDRKRTARVFTHKLDDRVALANLDSVQALARVANPAFSGNWEVVRVWSEESRYYTWSRAEAKAILDAIRARKGGVLPWIKQYW